MPPATRRWEPRENILSDALIDEFEERERKRKLTLEAKQRPAKSTRCLVRN